MNKCISLSDEILEKVRKEVLKLLNTKGLTTLDIESAIQSALNKEEGLTIEVLLDQKMLLINDAITLAKNNKIREKQLTEKESINSNILGIPLSVSTKKVDSSFKLNVSKNEDTLYIYPDSAQARTLNGETTTIKEGIVELDENNLKEVLTAKNQWAAARNDINGDKNKNSAGIVVRRNSRVPKGLDTNSFVAEDEKSFEQEVLSNIQEIKENIKDEKYKKVVIPEEFSGALPENLAKKLAELLYKELGITTQVILENAHKNLYKVKVNKPVLKNTKLSLKQTEINKLALESLQTERPVDKNAYIEEAAIDILKRHYPNLKVRKAHVDYLTTRFVFTIDSIINKAIKDLSASDPDEYYGYTGLLTNGDVLKGLKTGTDESKRYFAYTTLQFKVSEEDDKILGLVDYALYHIKKQVSEISLMTEKEIIEDILLDKTLFLGRAFLEECALKGIGELNDSNNAPAKMRNFAKVRAQNLKLAMTDFSDDDLFLALLQEAAFDLEFLEGVTFSFSDNNTVIGQSEDMLKSSELDEEDVAVGSMDHNYKYRLRNPQSTLSKNLKRTLGSLYQVEHKRGRTIPKYDFLGMPVRMNFSVVYAILLDKLAGSNTPEIFTERLLLLKTEMPWLSNIIDKAVPTAETWESGVFDPDFRNELYRACNKTYVQFGMLTATGRLKKLNRQTSSEALLANAEKNYSGGIVLTSYSIYKQSGEIDDSKKALVRSKLSYKQNKKAPKNLSEEKKKKYYIENEPFAFAIKTIEAFTKGQLQTNWFEDLQTAINILHDSEFNFSTLLQSIGIDTTSIHISNLLPRLDDSVDASTRDPKTGDILSAVLDEGGNKVYIPYLTMDNLKKVLEVVRLVDLITGSNTGVKEGEHLTKKYANYFLKIGTQLSAYSEGYTVNTFMHGDKNRYSFVVPNFIDKMCNAISSKDKSIAEEYINSKFEKADLYRNPKTGEWNHDILDVLLNDPIKGDILRLNFKNYQILSMYGSSKSNMVEKIAIDKLRTGVIDLFYSLNDIKDAEGDPIKMGLYRNPLFADSGAMVFISYERISGEFLEEIIINKLIKVARLELDRILANSNALDNPTQSVEFYNSKPNNSTKFNFIPELNDYLEELLSEYKIKDDESIEEATKRIDTKLYGYLSIIVENYYKRHAGKFSDDYKIKLVKRVSYNEVKDASKEDDVEDTEVLDSSEEAEVSESFNDDGDFNTDENAIAKKESEETEAEKSRKEELIERGERLIKEFYYNDFFIQSQLIQLYGGDIAFYKNFNDFVKRNKQAFTGGEQIFPYKEKEFFEEEDVLLKEKGIYLADAVRASNTYGDIMNLINNSSLDKTTKAFIRGALHSIVTTDGQSLRTTKSFRTIYKAMGGMWTDLMEEAYLRIISGNIQPDDFNTLFLPIKPFLFSAEYRTINGRTERIVTLHKNSEYLLSAAYSMLNSALNKSPLLLGLQTFMEKYDIDTAHFHSTVKEGYNNGVDIQFSSEAFSEMVGFKPTIGYIGEEKTFIWQDAEIKVNGHTIKATSYSELADNLNEALLQEKISQKDYNQILEKLAHKNNGKNNTAFKDLETLLTVEDSVNGSKELDEIMIHEFPMSDYMIMLPTTDHLMDTLAVFGSQLRNIVPADLPEDFSIALTIGNETVTLNKEETVLLYNRLLVDQYIDSYIKLDKRFSSTKQLSAELLAKMKQQPAKYGKDLLDAIKLNADGKFNSPLNAPNLKNKIEELILSTCANYIQRQKIHGGNVVLTANYGLHEDLKIEYKEDGTIDCFQCYMSTTMKTLLKDFLVEKKDGNRVYHVLDFGEMKKVLGKTKCEELLKAIGYRIPTENKYSIIPLKIVGFMPGLGGSTIMLPSDIVALSGSDFDIDKLFLMLKSIRRETYSGALRGAYKQWLENKQGITRANDHSLAESAMGGILAQLKLQLEEEGDELDALDDETYEKELKKIFKRTEGYNFTDEEIDSLVKNSSLFEEFMIEHEFDFLLKDPKTEAALPVYKIKTPKLRFKNGKLDLSSTVDLATKAERDNMLIDIISKILQSKAGSLGMVTPGNFEDVIKSSCVLKIVRNLGALNAFKEKYNITEDELYDKLVSVAKKEKGAKELDDLYDNNASGVNPLDVETWLFNHYNLMMGNDLIGILALNSGNHYKLQFHPFVINEANIIRINGKELSTIDLTRSELDGRLISDICALLLAAAPDNGKNPRLGDMNASTVTAPVLNLLSRLGVSIIDIGIILNSLDIQDLAALIKWKDIEDMVSKEEASEIFKNNNINIKDILNMKAKITLGKLEEISPIDLYKFKVWYSNLKKVAKDLNLMSEILRVDTQKGALSSDYAKAILKILRLLVLLNDTINNGDFTLMLNMDSLIDSDLKFEDADSFREACLSSDVPRLLAVFSLGIQNAPKLIGQYLSVFSPQSLGRVQKLLKELNFKEYNSILQEYESPKIKKFLTEVEMFLMTGEEVIHGNKNLLELRNYYIQDFPIKYKVLLLAVDEEGHYIYKAIRNLPSIQRISNKGNSGLKLDNIGKIDPALRRYYVEAFDELRHLTDGSPIEQEVAGKLAYDLLMYSFFDNGLNFRHNSFSNYFSTFFLEGADGLLEAYRKIDNLIRSDDFDDNVIELFLFNHPTFLTYLRRKQYERIFNRRTGKNYIKIKKNSAGLYPDDIYKNTTGLEDSTNNSYKKLITIKKDKKLTVCKLAEVSRDGVFYEIIDLETPEIPYYDKNETIETIEYSKLAKRGNVAFKFKGSNIKTKGSTLVAAEEQASAFDVSVDETQPMPTNSKVLSLDENISGTITPLLLFLLTQDSYNITTTSNLKINTKSLTEITPSDKENLCKNL